MLLADMYFLSKNWTQVQSWHKAQSTGCEGCHKNNPIRTKIYHTFVGKSFKWQNFKDMRKVVLVCLGGSLSHIDDITVGQIGTFYGYFHVLSPASHGLI